MTRFRLSAPAQRDLTEILGVSAARWGAEGRQRYAALLAAALRQAAADPIAATSRSRSRSRQDLLPGLRSLHTRHARASAAAVIRRPVHVIYYRPIEPGLIEIVRVLHERMDPSRHVES